MNAVVRDIDRRGGTTVGYITELDGVEAATVIYLRLWCSGPDRQNQVREDFQLALGADQGDRAVGALEQMCSLCARHGRRPLMRHSLNCKCLGADEACFANFVGAATEGDQEDAMMIAMLLVRHDIAPMIVGLAADFGLSLKRLGVSAPRDIVQPPPENTVFH